MSEEITRLTLKVKELNLTISLDELKEFLDQVELIGRQNEQVSDILSDAYWKHNREFFKMQNPIDYRIQTDQAFAMIYWSFESLRSRLKDPNYFPGEINPGFVYLIQAGEKYKIGRTTKPKNRFKALQKELDDKGIKSEIKPLFLVDTKYHSKLEKYYHSYFFWKEPKTSRHDSGEWFYLDSDDLDDFIKIGVFYGEVYTVPDSYLAA